MAPAIRRDIQLATHLFRLWFFAAMAPVVLSGLAVAQPNDYQVLKARAERFYTELSYQEAHDLYQQADTMTLPPQEARWVDFRLADTRWRSAASTRRADSSKLDQARQQLEALGRDVRHSEDHDRIWAEVHESLGDFWWARQVSRDWGRAWPHYRKALDWWAGARDLERARQRYLGMVWNMTTPAWMEPYRPYGHYGTRIPLDVLENAIKITRGKSDLARAHYLVAMRLRNTRSDRRYQQRVRQEFEAALEAGRSTAWYDDALFHFGEWLSRFGQVIVMQSGQTRWKRDYVKAVDLFRRLTGEFKQGETRYYKQAKRNIEAITKPRVSVKTSNIFLPDSGIQFNLDWRNLKRIDLALYKIDLTREVEFSGKMNSSQWLHQINLHGAGQVKFWSKETADKGDHEPGAETIILDEKLPLGAYILEATGGTVSSRDLVLVTDVSLVLKTAGRQALLYFCNAFDGSPIVKGNITLWERYTDGKKRVWQAHEQTTDKDGLALFELADTSRQIELFVGAARGDRQAFTISRTTARRAPKADWRIYAFTDRPAYRPDETVQWKIMAREYDGSVYATPAHRIIEYSINDPRVDADAPFKARIDLYYEVCSIKDRHDGLNHFSSAEMRP